MHVILLGGSRGVCIWQLGFTIGLLSLLLGYCLTWVHIDCGPAVTSFQGLGYQVAGTIECVVGHSAVFLISLAGCLPFESATVRTQYFMYVL